MTYNTIQIFASDHRTGIKWSLPFIRIAHSSDVINLASNEFLYKYKDLLSEPAKMMFAYKHIDEFGDPEFIGFCHYRRYFALCSQQYQNRIVIEDPDHKLTNCILSPTQQLMLMNKFNVDGLLEFPFLDEINADKKYQTIVDMFNNVINTMSNINAQNTCPLSIPYAIIEHWIEQFEKNLPIDLKPYFKNALACKSVYHSNIFTARKEICDIYFPLLDILITDMIKFVDHNCIQIPNSRWLAYVIEYLFSNIFFHILLMSGKFKFMHCQLLVQ